jgi:hypothetical protein
MSNTVNLKQARKEKIRAKKRGEGDANALKFGQSKAEKLQRMAELKRARAALDGHKRDITE